MEYVEGANLRQLMLANELLPDQSVALVPQICEALHYAHAQGVVHRDIKPENILVDGRGRVKIADFGLAKLAEHAPHDLTLTGTHQVMGTPQYMAPEQMAGSKSVDHRADIYSLGVVFYELLTGEVPMGQFEPPSRKAAVDSRLDDVVLTALAREPERRFQSAGELKSRVDEISSSEVQAGYQPSNIQPYRAGASTIIEREAFAAWQWIRGDVAPSDQQVQVPLLLMLTVCLAGCLTILLPWMDVGISDSWPAETVPFATGDDENTARFCVF
jgi:serine/threonine protein kinase